MSKIVIISNRLPTTVKKDANGQLQFIESIGGLATGLKAFHQRSNSVWIGWPGITNEELKEQDSILMRQQLKEDYKCLAVDLTENEIEQFYHGFSNKTLWPLFHYFIDKTNYDENTWRSYQKVNKKFFQHAKEVIQPNDIVWIHDYQLLLLPEMIKNHFPSSKIGFFLHIPFPSYEIFRLLIWRKELLRGMLGADLIGFHTYDYVWHFLNSTRRILGLDELLNKVIYEDRMVHVNAFPMGIEYERFFHYVEPKTEQSSEEKSSSSYSPAIKKILSVDRLDYTKGIPQRIKAFECFLDAYPEYHEKVTFMLIVAPSRVEVDEYYELLKEIQELVSEVNGKYATMDWMPVWFFFRKFSQEQLIHYYRNSDVLLVTPLRDGMNLVAKEYIASRNDYKGMVVISETAGAANELGEAIIVNANDCKDTALGIKKALEISVEGQIQRNSILHQRLKRANVNFWGEEFLTSIKEIDLHEEQEKVPFLNNQHVHAISRAYQQASQRILFLDYDGTLVGFTSSPEQARPDKKLMELLSQLAKDPYNTVVIISGRERHALWNWLGHLKLHFVASHGLWLRHPGQKDWRMMLSLDNEWKEVVKDIMESYSDRIPGSFVEEKDYSLVWHYRQCDPKMADIILPEIKETLMTMMNNTNLCIQEGKKIIEVKDAMMNKGLCVSHFLPHQDYDFIFAMGDDSTDEDMFSALPGEAYSVKVGIEKTHARYRTKSWQSARELLKELMEKS